jgi:hypothetical protein
MPESGIRVATRLRRTHSAALPNTHCSGHVLSIFPIRYVPRELRIAFETKIAHRIPKIDRPLMLMFHEGHLYVHNRSG